MKRFIFILLLICPIFVTQSGAQHILPAGYQYIFPGPESTHIHASSTVILRFDQLAPEHLKNLSTCIKVRGEQSGPHSGTTIIASDRRTIIFESERAFESGEKVRLSIEPRFSESSGKTIRPFYSTFTVQHKKVGPQTPKIADEIKLQGSEKNLEFKGAQIMDNGVSVPADFPHVRFTENNNPSSDHIFLNNWGPPNYNIIFNTSGDPVWYWKTADRRRDFKTHANGLITMLIRQGYGGYNGHIVLTENFEFIKVIRAGNGYETDEHELVMLPDSGYLFIGKKETTVDMSKYVLGGQTDATVRETSILEFTADDQLVFIWRAWDHFNILDLELDDLTGSYIRFPHMNALDIDSDGHILLSSRNLSEISKIHRQSGEFIWRMNGVPGSPNNNFEFIDDPFNGFRNQHAIRSLGNNRYTLFDNGNLRSPQISRAVEYELDTVEKTATLVWEQRSELEQEYSFYMGNAQRLDNGNTHINWAVGHLLPIAAEYTPEGEKVLEMWFEDGYHCYRSFRHPWEGICRTPYLLLEQQADNLTLIFNKFGDNTVDYYNIYGGNSPNPGTLIDTSFSTLKQLRDLENGLVYYYRVTAVDANGIESDFSNEESIRVRIAPPGTNLIVNGDFSDSLDAWIWETGGSAEAEVRIVDSTCHFAIEDGGADFGDLILRQKNIPLIQGHTYTLEFDAWAVGSRIVEIEIGGAGSPFNNYSRIGYTALSSTLKTYAFSFEMMESTDINSQIVINAGASAQDFYMDNISLKLEESNRIDEKLPPENTILSLSNYPNPFYGVTTIKYALSNPCHILLRIFDGFGRELLTLVDQEHSPGTYEATFDARHLKGGVYYYSIESGNFLQSRKMLLLR